MKLFLSFVLFLLAAPVFSQDVTGIWRGYFQQGTYNRSQEGSLFDDRYKIEVQLDQQGTRFQGVTYSYRSTVFYGKASATGAVNRKNQKVLLEELKILEVRMAGPSDACIMTIFLQYSKSGENEFMEGTYTSMNIRDSTSCGRGTIFLQKVTTSDFYKEPFLVKREKEKSVPPVKKDSVKTTIAKAPVKKPETKTTNPPKKTNPPVVVKKPVTKEPEKPVAKNEPKSSEVKASADSAKKAPKKIETVVTPRVLASRQNEVVKTITSNANEISIKVYDNGSIDNDTVSVYLDKKLVISKQRLTEKAIVVKFNLDETNDYHELVMVAENLGEIPPNTSLMVVTAGTKQYEVRITSNEQKNAVVIFKYEKN